MKDCQNRHGMGPTQPIHPLTRQPLGRLQWAPGLCLNPHLGDWTSSPESKPSTTSLPLFHVFPKAQVPQKVLNSQLPSSSSPPRECVGLRFNHESGTATPWLDDPGKQAPLKTAGSNSGTAARLAVLLGQKRAFRVVMASQDYSTRAQAFPTARLRFTVFKNVFYIATKLLALLKKTRVSEKESCLFYLTHDWCYFSVMGRRDDRAAWDCTF